MTLHKDKFEYMCHHFNRSNILSELPYWTEYFTYTVSEDITLYPVNQLCDLGVLVASDLSWSPHIKSIADKAKQKAAWVLSVFHTRSSVVMLTLYKSMVRSLLEYCSPLWNPVKISDRYPGARKRPKSFHITHCWDARFKLLGSTQTTVPDVPSSPQRDTS